VLDITRSYLPSLQKYLGYVEGIYARGHLTNHGPLVRELTERLESYLGVRNLVLVCNGSAALDLAYHALNVTGSVVTTPFSFVASSSVPVWHGIDPVFADIDPLSWNLDPGEIESAIRADTTAIAPVHVYGNPVDDARVSEIARRRGLKVIYDAAHCFGVRKGGQSILRWGDASTISFHATKVFHTVEGGAVVFRDDAVCERARRMINFGMDPVTGDIVDTGTNLKLSEMHAAMGLAMLDDMDEVIERRRHLADLYRRRLGDNVQCQKIEADVTLSGSYMPVAFADAPTCERVMATLGAQDIRTRRYFSPSLDATAPYARFGSSRYSQQTAARVLCLPLYAELLPDDVERVCAIVLGALRATAGSPTHTDERLSCPTI
jgi:dTDP-4-amino-4,6-dideoxygalactose transaminase